MRQNLSKLFLFVIWLYIPGFIFAQTPNIPIGPDGSPLPNYQDRLNQLIQSGIDPSGLPSIPLSIQRPGQGLGSQTGTLNVNQPPNPISPLGSANPSTPPTNPNQAPIELEGTDPVLDEDEAAFESRPKEAPGQNLTDVKSNVFGHRIFSQEGFDFKQNSSNVPPEDYIIGPGDNFFVNVYNGSELTTTLLVEPDGSVSTSYTGKAYVAGLSYAQARDRIKRLIRNVVSSQSTIEIRLTSDIRPITVNIVGEVFKPASYRIDASTPAFNALFAAGGVNDIGSVRNILIKRNGKLVQIVDLYDYLIFGRTEPVYLQNNDFIIVPPQGKIVKITGPVRRPMEYELLPGENLKQLLTLSGGLTYDAKTSKAQVARLENEREVLIDFELASVLENPNKDFRLTEGDHIILQEVIKGAYNVVQVFGDVQYPGTYQLTEGDKIVDLVLKAGGLGIEAYRERAYIVRIVPNSRELLYIPLNLSQIFNPDSLIPDTNNINNLDLKFFDALIIFSQQDFLDDRFIDVEGLVRNPGTFRTSPTMTLKDLLFLVGGPQKDADYNNIELSTITRAEDLVKRKQNTDDEQAAEASTADAPTTDGQAPEGDAEGDVEGDDPEVIQRIAISTDWENDPVIDTLRVYNFDRVKVYSKYDFIFFQYVDVEGAVKNPGRYQVKRGMNLKDILYQAGGLEEFADESEIELYKDIDISERGNYNTRTPQKEIERIKIRKDWQTSTLADSLSVEGYRKIVVRSELDFFQPGSVTIKGLVNNPGTYEVSPNMTLKDLIYMAEGLKIEADFDNIELSRVFISQTDDGQIIPVPISLQPVRCSQNWQEDSTLDQIKVNAFDQVIIRKNPDFQLQESVFLSGEVFVEGEYNKKRKDERLNSLVARAGGITELAYVEGAYIMRPDRGQIAIKLNKALRRPNSRFNVPLLEGDTLVIPERVDIVGIEGNVLKPGTQVLYEPTRKRMKYYVNLAGGFDRRTQRNKITVTYVDGRVKSSKRIMLVRFYPKVEQGAIIDVAARPEREQRERRGLNINLQEVLASATSLLTFYLLIDRTFVN
ncbi:MAG: SLBB domain-containing protein [Bacteroidota bacterium]